MRDYSDHCLFLSPYLPTLTMPINLPPISQQLIKGVEQARAEQMATLSKIIGITVGNNVLATVEKVEPINPQQREELLKRTQETLLQLYRSPATPAVKAQIAQLLEQQQMLSSTQVKWAHLQINGRPLLIYTDKPLLAGQSVPVQLSNPQRLVLVAPLLAPRMMESLTASSASPSATTVSTPALSTPALSTLALSAPALSALSTKLASELNAAGNRVPTSATATTADQPATGIATDDRKQTQMLLAEVLRNLLPHKDQPQQLYSALPQLQQLPVGSRHQLLSNSLQQALKTVADQLRSPMQLSNPKLLQMIVKNSGVFFEHKLAQNLPATTNAAPKPAEFTHLKNTLGNPENSQAVISNRLTTQDLKGALLQLLNRVNQDLVATSKLTEAARPSVATTYTAPGATTPVTGQFSSASLMPTLAGLLQLLQQPTQRSGPELSHKVLRTQLLMLLQQYTLGSLAKVQLQQAHTLNHQQNQSDTAQPTQSWLFDIPIKHGQDVHNLELRLEQSWVDDEKQNDESNTKIRQWSVILSFNLPDAGGFHAQLTVVNETVSAKLWAEQDGTLNEAKIKLDNLRTQLESQGVVVKQLSCVKGTPPSTTISLNYSLVDVNT